MNGKANNIIYIDEQELDSVGPLWQKLKEHHKKLSPHFPGHYEKMTWEKRKRDLIEKSKNGSLYVDIARDNATDKIVGYCVSTINEKGQGEIDSIYVEESYRRCGIGNNLVKRALSWMDGLSVTGVMVEIASGNEAVVPFYNRFDFRPRSFILRQQGR